jgi:hypothetical protein
MRIACVALAAVLVASACDQVSTSLPPEENPVSFAQDVQPIFTASCGPTCHVATTTQPPTKPMNLQAGAAYANIVNVQAAETDTSTLLDRIEPGDPEASYLIHKIQGTHTAASVRGRGQRMPLACPVVTPPRACLTAEEIQLIRQWVVEGAANN